MADWGPMPASILTESIDEFEEKIEDRKRAVKFIDPSTNNE